MTYQLASNLNSDRYRVIVCCLYSLGELGERLREQGIPVLVLNARSSANPLYLPQNLDTIRRLQRLLRRERVQIVQTHEFFSGTLGRVAARLSGVPVTILMLHNKDRWKRTPHVLIDRLLARWTDVIVANSHSVKEFTVRYEKLRADKFVVIHNGIDMNRFTCYPNQGLNKRAELGFEPDTPMLTIVGRLTAQKGHRYLMDALPVIRDRFPDLRLLIVGDDSPHDVSTKEMIFQQVQALGLTDNVIFLGQRRDVPDILCATDLFVLPSLWEGFGLAVAEAMAAGKPVVASRVDGIPEVVEDGVTGILVPPQDPGALARAILFLLGNKQRAEAMGQAGRERIERCFTLNRMVSQWDELYQHLARKKGLIQEVVPLHGSDQGVVA